MKLSYALSILLPVVAVLANPIPDGGAEDPAKLEASKGVTARDDIAIRDAEAESAGLVSRATETCSIVNVVTTVSCRWNPWHAGWNGKGGSSVRTDFGPGTKHDFSCYNIGECIGGNCTWDWAENWQCYVPGYYTSSACSMAKLGKCDWSDSGNNPPW